MIQTPERRNSDSIKWSLYDKDVQPLWVADMDFTSPPEVIEALHQRVAHGVFGYGKDPIELKELIVERMRLLHGWRITCDDVMVVPGVVSGFNLACQAVASEGDSILIQPPVYPPFFGAPGTASARTLTNDLIREPDGRYRLDPDDFEATIEPATRAFLLCNPHNPVGRVFTREELLSMAGICLKHHVVIISDEIHCDLVYRGYQHIPIASLDSEISASTVTLIAPSKTFNIAGLDCSILICTNHELRDRIKQAKRGLMGGVNLLGIAAATAAYRDGQSWLDEVLGLLEENRDFLLDYLAHNLPGIKAARPESTYLAWLDCSDLALPDRPDRYFLEHARVGLNNGEDFGTPGKGHVRLNFGCSRQVLEEALERMRRSV